MRLLLPDRGTWSSDDLVDMFLEGKAGPSGLPKPCGWVRGVAALPVGSRRALSRGVDVECTSPLGDGIAFPALLFWANMRPQYAHGP